MKPKSWYDSANLAVEGILYAARTQKHMRWHFMAAALVVLLGLYFGLDKMEFIALSVAIVLVLVTEILNTAIEATVDLASEAFHPLAKVAKDTAAGAVFVASFGAVVLGYFILYPHISDAFTKAVGTVMISKDNLAFSAVIVVIIAVIIFKAFLGRGKPLQGGMPSGHAATAFAIWVAVSFLTANLLISALVFVVAVMVSHSRVALGIHNRREVVLGALLGGLVTLLMFLIFG